MSDFTSDPDAAGAGEESGEILTEFDVPISDIEEMFPAVVNGCSEVYLNEGTPLRALGLPNESESGLGWGPVCLERITRDAGADDILPGCRSTSVARDDVIQIQIFAIECFVTVLAGISIAFEDVVAGEFDLLFGEAIEHEQQNDARDADLERDGVDTVVVLGFDRGEVSPLIEVERVERSVIGADDDLSVALEQ